MPLDVGELLSTGTVPCISAPQFYVSFWKTGATVIQQCALHGTSLSSDVLIARVRTLALCWTRRHPTIAYKYHGSLLWIVQLGTNIRETCRWIVNLFLADAEVQLTNITWGVKSKRFGYLYSFMQNSRQGHPQKSNKKDTMKNLWHFVVPEFTHGNLLDFNFTLGLCDCGFRTNFLGVYENDPHKKQAG